MVRLTLLLLAVLQFFQGSQQCNQTAECCTEKCRSAAEALKYNMNISGDPCDDFFNYACGGFVDQTAMPIGKDLVDWFSITQNKTNELLRQIVQQPIKTDDTLAAKLMKTYFNSCMDEVQIDNSSVTELKQLMANLGGWPVITDNWDPNTFFLNETLLNFHAVGLQSTLLIQVNVYNGTDGKTNVELVFPESLDKDSSENGELVPELTIPHFLQFMLNYTKIFGANETIAREDMTQVIDFEYNLTQLSLQGEYFFGGNFSFTDDDDETFDNFTINDLENKFPGFPWLMYIRQLVSPFFNVDASQPVVIKNTNYYSNLIRFLNGTSKRTVSNFLFWMAAYENTDCLSTQLRELKQAILWSNNSALPPRYEVCLESLQKEFDLELGYMYLNYFYNKNETIAARYLSNNLTSNFNNTLKNSTWMSNATKENALKKLEAAKVLVGEVQDLDNFTYVDSFYSDLKLSNKSYLTNYLMMNIFGQNKTYLAARHGDNIAELQLLRQSDVVKVDYFDYLNAITVPAAILQEIYFENNRTDYLNYAGLGYIFSGILSTGFDKWGSSYDKNGNQKDWWDNQTRNAYEEKIKCFEDQYKNMTSKTHPRLRRTAADVTGIQQSYSTYLSLHPTGEMKLPSFNFTTDQVFWLQIGSVFCEKLSTRMEKYNEDLDKISRRDRLNLAVGNIRTFHQSWNCSAEKKLSYNKTCSVY